MRWPRDPGTCALGVALLVVAVVGAKTRDAVTDLLSMGGAPVAQRPLAGGTTGRNPPVTAPVRVVLIDGLSRGDAGRLPALAGLCAGGLAVTVDVGFPTKSLPVQRVLWSGLTAQQSGSPYGNQLAVWPPSAVPAMVGGLAVVESHGDIARSVGFEVVEPGVSEPDPGPLDGAITAAVAGDRRLVMVHLLGVDVAAHRQGRRGSGYRDALARADQQLAAALAAAPGAQWLVLSDHGHIASGGHGDAEDEVRRVQACWAPAPPGVTAAPGAELHLVDVARWLAEAVDAPRDPHAVGRTLATAIAHPDRDATLPVVPWWRWLIAGLIVLTGLTGGLLLARPRLAASWPIGAILVIAIVHGVPSLSARASPLLLAGTGALLAAAACLSGVRTKRDEPRNAAGLVVFGLAIALALAILSGVPGALLAGAPPRTPFWTGALAAAVQLLAGACFGLGVTLSFHGCFKASR